MLVKSSGENLALNRWESCWVRLGEGKASLALSPAPAEDTAHRWCKNLSEKQELSGGKFPVPGWTENKTNIKKKKMVSKFFFAIQCLVTQNLSRPARNFHLNWEFYSVSKDAFKSHNLLLRYS